ncbi:MAG: carboxypeptidase-like regulatory domain-containing protein, partial [Tannerellaceae bacterium]|nr:carboxypeptidase-like regulatory domain-containing protein [Tannerellaceae bacterium]
MKTNLLQNIRYGRNFFRPYLLILLVWICNNSGAFAQFGPDEGTGSSGDPYKISTPAQLDAVRSNLNKHFVLVNNIDLTQYITDTYSGVGWAPIGDYSNRFRGKFNGNGKTISGLWIDRTTNAVGLFGAVASPATISSLIVEIDPGRSVKGNQYVGGLAGYNIDEGFITDSYVIGSVEGTSYVGGLVGHNAGGSISRSYAIGSVEGTSYVGGLVGGASVPTFYPSIIEDSHADSSVSGDDYVGGLVGDNSGGSISRSYAFGSVEGAKFVGGLVGRARSAVDPWSGTIIAITTISYSHAASSVSGDENVGGLVGGSSEGSIITTSYAIGEVGKTDAVQVGGLVGYNNESIITNCYATGEVTGKDNVGGLLGQNDNYNSPDPTVTKCYATGKVTGTNSVGGFIGLNTGQFQFCTFDSETTEQIQGIGNHNDALGSLGTVLMMKEITYKNLLWDFDDVWEIEEDVSYPYFKPNPSAPIVITDAATSGVKVNLLNNAVNVVVYVNGVYHSTQTSNVDAGDQTFNLSGLKLGDVVKLVTYEPGKAPSDPVSGIVYATVTLNVVDENGDPVSGADITFDGVTYTDGTHVFKNLLGPSYSYKVEKSGYKTATGSVTVTGDKTEDVELFSKPIATGLDISGSKVIAVEVNGVAISFNRTVTAVTGGKIT